MEQSHKSSLVQMDFIQKITLSPFQKYVRYDRFPYKFVLHLLLLALCTYQALRIVSLQDKHTRIQQQIFSTIYLQSDDGSSSYPYYSLSQFTDKFFAIIDSTQTIDEMLLQYSDVQGVIYQMRIYYTDVSPDKMSSIIISGDAQEYQQKLNQIPLHRQDVAEMKQFIQDVQSIEIRIYSLFTYISADPDGTLSSCLNWTITINYNFQSFANVQSSLEAQSLTCALPNAAPSSQITPSLLGVHVAVLIAAAVSLILSWRQVYFVSKEYMYYKRQMEGGKSQLGSSRFKSHLKWEKTWEELGFFQKLRFFDFWFVVIVAGNFCQLFGAFVAILDHAIDADLAIFEHKQVLIGFGVMLAWITILKYLQYSNNLNLMTATLAKSWGNLFIFLLGVMPFFLGFVFLGQTIFWKYSKFQDTSSSIITLFSLLNGDIVNDTFLQTWAEGLGGQLYLIVFMVLFYTAVQNVFITIIMEGYEESIKEREHKKMLEMKERKERQNFQRVLEEIPQEDQSVLPRSPELSPQQHTSLSKIRRNSKKIDLILQEMGRVFTEVSQSQLSANQKMYLNKLLRQNIEAVGRNVKMQINELRK